MRMYILIALLTLYTMFGNKGETFAHENVGKSVSATAKVESNNFVSVGQYGAIGDGVTDDSASIQAALDSGFNIRFEKNHIYRLRSNGLYITKDIEIDGNGATILIDDTYNPQDSNFDSYIIRNKYNNCFSYLYMHDIDIKVDILAQRDIEHLFCVLSPTYIDNVVLDNVNIDIASSYNRITAIYLNHGCGYFALKNSSIVNRTTYLKGGVLFLQASDENLFNKYNSFDNILIEKCYFYGNCGDEVIAFYGENNLQAIVEDCIIEGYLNVGKSTRPISVYTKGDNNADIEVTFSQCTFNTAYNIDLENCYYDSFLGVGTNCPSNSIKVLFNGCNIQAKVQSCFLMPACYQSDPSQTQEFDFLNENISVIFENSDIDCNRPFSGNGTEFCENVIDIPAMNFEINQCNVRCRDALVYLSYAEYKRPYYYTPKIKLKDTKVIIDNARAVVASAYSNLPYTLQIEKCTFADVERFFYVSKKIHASYVSQKNSKCGIEIGGMNFE